MVISDNLIKLKRAKMPVKKHRKTLNRLRESQFVAHSIDTIEKKSSNIKVMIEHFYWQNKKIADDNKHIFSNVRKFKEEQLNKTKEIFERLFTILLKTNDEVIPPSTPTYSDCTYETDITENNYNFEISKGQKGKGKISSDSFRRLADARQIIGLNTLKDVRNIGFESQNHLKTHTITLKDLVQTL